MRCVTRSLRCKFYLEYIFISGATVCIVRHIGDYSIFFNSYCPNRHRHLLSGHSCCVYDIRVLQRGKSAHINSDFRHLADVLMLWVFWVKVAVREESKRQKSERQCWCSMTQWLSSPRWWMEAGPPEGSRVKVGWWPDHLREVRYGANLGLHRHVPQSRVLSVQTWTNHLRHGHIIISMHIQYSLVFRAQYITLTDKAEC